MSAARKHVVALLDSGNPKAATVMFALMALVLEHTDWFDNAQVFSVKSVCPECGAEGSDSPVGFWPGPCPDCFQKMLDRMPLPESPAMLDP